MKRGFVPLERGDGQDMLVLPPIEHSQACQPLLGAKLLTFFPLVSGLDVVTSFLVDLHKTSVADSPSADWV